MLHLASRDIDPRQWDHFIQRSPQGAPYALHGYATAVCPDWEAYILQRADRWLAVMPVNRRKKWGFTAVLQPSFTQYWGIFFSPELPTQGYAHYSEKRKLVRELLPPLDELSQYDMRFSPAFDYPLPFHWQGYRLSTRYTYQLPLAEPEQLFAGFSAPLQRQINKAQRAGLQARPERDFAALEALIDRQLAAGHDMPLRGNLRQCFRRLLRWLEESSLGDMWIVRDSSRRALAAGLFLRFHDTMYYLQGAYLPETKQSGAMSLLMWQALSAARKAGCRLIDFEGSMIEGIEGFFRKFGARPVPYLHIHKNTLPLILQWMREFV